MSYAIGDVGTWLAWRLMRETRRALADNLRAIFPDESTRALERRARDDAAAPTRATSSTSFARSALRQRERQALFDYRPEDAQLFHDLLARGRGIILVTGHYGNWEIGSVLMRRDREPAAHDHGDGRGRTPEVNRLRREIRDRLGVDTIEVRQSLDTALQIRRRLADNHVVAMLMDRHLGRDRVEVPFLGRPAWFLRTPALMGF